MAGKGLFNRHKTKGAITQQAKILVVTEGTDTEPDYFSEITRKYHIPKSLLSVRASGHSAPISVVGQAKKFFRQGFSDKDGRHLDAGDFDLIYAVMDVDQHESLQEAINQIDKFNQVNRRAAIMTPIISCPCFDLWYLLHFDVPIPSGLSPAQAKKMVGEQKSALQDKSRDFMESLMCLDHMGKAIKGAMKLRKERDDIATVDKSRSSSMYTDMDLLLVKIFDTYHQWIEAKDPGWKVRLGVGR